MDNLLFVVMCRWQDVQVGAVVIIGPFKVMMVGMQCHPLPVRAGHGVFADRLFPSHSN
jgi:hypothetical protein